MSKQRFRMGQIALLAGALALSACSYAPVMTGNIPSQSAMVAKGKGVLTLQPQVNAGGYRLQSIVSPYTKASIQHLVVKVFALVNGVEVPVIDGQGNQVSADLLNSELDDPVTFGNLMIDTTYRIRCYAYKAAGTAGADLISTNDSQSYVDVVVANDDRPVMASLKVKLIDVIFNGEATSSGVIVTDGGFQNNGPVTIGKGFKAFVSSIAGNGTDGYADGPAASAMIANVSNLAFDSAGNLYFTDDMNYKVRKLDTNGNITTLPGSYFHPRGVAVDASGNVFVADAWNRRIVKITTDDQVEIFASGFSNPSNITFDLNGNLVIADMEASLLKKVAPNGMVTTFSTSQAFACPSMITSDRNGNLYLVDGPTRSAIYKIDQAGQVTLFAGNGVPGYADGVGAAAQFNQVAGLAVDAANNLYVSDISDYRIRKVTPDGVVSTVAGNGIEGYQDGPAMSAQFNRNSGIAFDSTGNLIIGDYGAHRIRKLHLH
ncbi:hypothetical protein J7643_15170 [bacterium]|nr:hypothetical protein [bacterium]